MMVLGYFLIALANLINGLVGLFLFAIFIRVILSWVRHDESGVFVQIVNGITDPLLLPVKRRIPPLGMLDLSPLIVLFGLYFARDFLCGVLLSYGNQLVLH